MTLEAEAAVPGTGAVIIQGKRRDAMKKPLLVLLALLMLALAVPAGAEDTDDFVIDGYGVLIRYCGPGGDAAIPEGVTKIGENAFSDCTSLTGVTIPDSVTVIGVYAFSGCTSLTDVFIPGSVKSIYGMAFSGCSSLTSVTFGEGVVHLGNNVFGGCSGLTSLTLPASMIDVSSDAFEACSGLEEILVSAENPAYCSVGGVLFDKAMTALLKYPEARSGPYAVPAGVTRLGMRAFKDCGGLTEVTLPDSIDTIDAFAFQNCGSLREAAMPGGVTVVDHGTFSGCGALEHVTIPAGVTRIAGDAFKNCKSLKEAVLPVGLTEIGTDAFAYCYALRDVTIPESVTCIDADAFGGTPWLRAFGDFAVVNGILLEYRGREPEVTVPEGVTAIGVRAFYGLRSLKSVAIPEGVTSIGWDAFAGCTALEHVTLPSTVTEVGADAFRDTPWLASLGDFFIVNGALVKYLGAGGSVTIPGDVTRIGRRAFSGCYALWSVAIPDGVTRIGKGVFSGCTFLTNVTLPEGVTEIGDEAFSNCYYLQEAAIPAGVKRIGGYAFRGCGSLTKVTIPEGVTEIGDGAFSFCDGLTSVRIPATVTKIGRYAFSNCPSLTSVRVSCSPLELGEALFEGCEALSSVALPAAERAAVPMKSDKLLRDSYNSRHGYRVESCLYWDGEGYVRAERTEGLLVVERYSPSFQLLTSRSLESDWKERWGGFFIGEKYNYVFTGWDNRQEDDGAPVITVTKYDKQWEKLGQTSLCGANTTIPFRSGSLRCAEFGDMLYVHTSHLMYADAGGTNHQSNLTFALRQSDLTITDARYGVSNSSYGYVSHSFDQYILATGERELVTLDLGDGAPRALVLLKYESEAGSETINGRTLSVILQDFPGLDGDNTTGATAGGVGETTGGIVAAWNFNGVGTNSEFIATEDLYPVRNVFFSYTDKTDFSEEGTKTLQLTDFPAEGVLSAGRPALVSAGPEGGYILWEVFYVDRTSGSWSNRVYEDGPVTLAWAKYDAKGNVGEVHTAPGALSDCPPVCVEGKIVWYVTEDSVPTFYTLDDSGLTAQTALWQAPEAVKVRTNGELVWWTDAEPFIDGNNRTMVPLRAVAEALGLTVSWDGEAREAAFTDGVRTLIFPIGSTEARTGDGGTVEMDTAAVIVGGRTYAPIRYLAEYFGCDVAWDAKSRTVLLERGA